MATEAASPTYTFLLPTGSKVTVRTTKLLGGGGFGTVHKAVRISDIDNESPAEEYAVKTILRTDGWDRGVLDAIHRLTDMTHDNLVQYFACDVVEDEARSEYRLCILQEFCTGPTLAQQVKSPAKKPLELVDKYALQLLRGLSFLHHQLHPAIVHTDLTSSNILLSSNLEKLKITDYDHSIRLKHTRTFTGDISSQSGTPYTMSPEMIRGRTFHDNPVGRRTDIWSAGCVIFEMLAGEVPSVRTDTGTIKKLIGLRDSSDHFNGVIKAAHLALQKLDDHYTKLRHVVENCLRLNAEERPSAYELSNALDNFNLLKVKHVDTTALSADERKAFYDGITTTFLKPLRGLNSENLITYLVADIFIDSAAIFKKSMWFVTENLPSTTLATVIKDHRLPWTLIAAYTQQCCEGLKCLRMQNLAHMDLRMSDIYLTNLHQPSGIYQTVKIGGIAESYCSSFARSPGNDDNRLDNIVQVLSQDFEKDAEGKLTLRPFDYGAYIRSLGMTLMELVFGSTRAEMFFQEKPYSWNTWITPLLNACLDNGPRDATSSVALLGSCINRLPKDTLKQLLHSTNVPIFTAKANHPDKQAMRKEQGEKFPSSNAFASYLTQNAAAANSWFTFDMTEMEPVQGLIALIRKYFVDAPMAFVLEYADKPSPKMPDLFSVCDNLVFLCISGLVCNKSSDWGKLQLPNLVFLEFGTSSIRIVERSLVEKLPKLRKLSFFLCKIDKFEQECFDDLCQLEVLKLSKNILGSQADWALKYKCPVDVTQDYIMFGEWGLLCQMISHAE